MWLRIVERIGAVFSYAAGIFLICALGAQKNAYILTDGFAQVEPLGIVGLSGACIALGMRCYQPRMVDEWNSLWRKGTAVLAGTSAFVILVSIAHFNR
jgi:hypothetical protein